MPYVGLSVQQAMFPGLVFQVSWCGLIWVAAPIPQQGIQCIELPHSCVQRLPKETLDKPEFESYFVGAESKIDQVLSSTWLKQHTKHWTWKNYIMANTPRQALTSGCEF